MEPVRDEGPEVRFGLTVAGLRALGRLVPRGLAGDELVTPAVYRRVDEIDEAIGALRGARARQRAS